MTKNMKIIIIALVAAVAFLTIWDALTLTIKEQDDRIIMPYPYLPVD